MLERPEIELVPAGPHDAGRLANLLELYIHDLSDIFPQVSLGDDGRFGYPSLPEFWQTPETRFAFFIHRAGRVIGFVLASRGSPVSADPAVLDVKEFFVLKALRRAGVAQEAARQLWTRLPGTWTVRVSARNASALAAWRRILQATVPESHERLHLADWHIFTFSTRSDARLL